ncbi:MAG: efflux RND transporter periplasmic adaptor subunit [Planctomycetes bacterium]|nr:efflux RND transporter periplasmic adaptor subunit [Planctomycetota bacterium]
MNLRSVLTGLRKSVVVLTVLAAMTLLVMWLSGVFDEKVPRTETPADIRVVLPAGTATVQVASRDVPVVEEAVGAIRAVQEIRIASRILARIREMHVENAGQAVTAGDVLVELEDADLRARLREAQAAARAAVETMQQAERDLARTRELHGNGIASDLELERDRTRLENAKADVDRTAQAAVAAETLLDFAVIRSPIDGVVIDKLREKGDTVAPGELLMTLYDPTRMQLVASVREQLATRLEVGGDVQVAIDALGLRCHGRVSEIVPLAEPGSRAFDVKVVGPCPDGVFTGMFGRLLVPRGTRKELRVPLSAVREFGQIDQVLVVNTDDPDGKPRVTRRFVVLGDRADDEVAILSGLTDGETIVADAAALREVTDR